ncbi:MAG: CbtB-domain containing protein [Bryobacterales bacterium]|nr:CbtB-domain containing protein [Bryobacterales bacterium]
MSAIATTREASVVQTFGLAVRLPAVLVMIFGLVIVYAVGFSPFTRAHNAAHDTRHANGFPCH